MPTNPSDTQESGGVEAVWMAHGDTDALKVESDGVAMIVKLLEDKGWRVVTASEGEALMRKIEAEDAS